MTMCVEPFGAEYTKKMCVAVPGPLGDGFAKFEEAKMFMARCYKIVTTNLTGQDESLILTPIIDTGLGSI